MRIGEKHYRNIWKGDEAGMIRVIDQRKLPFEFRIMDLKHVDDVVFAIREMVVRGAPLIGVTAAYGMYLAALHSTVNRWKEEVENAGRNLVATRPTAVNLQYAVDLCLEEVRKAKDQDNLKGRLSQLADRLAEDEVERSRLIGEHGAALIREIYQEKCGPVNILTHCNAGWLACVDYGTATAPIYKAHEEGIPVHVWVDETRPRNQGARLTAFELDAHGIDHTVIVDNAGGLLMQEGSVDLVIVGSDRTSRKGDVANKIGTYLKALSARDNRIPFYVALPTSTIDLSLEDGFGTEIENRDSFEVSHMEGWDEERGMKGVVRILPVSSGVFNPGFDITPARLVSALITEKGICDASEEGILSLMGEG